MFRRLAIGVHGHCMKPLNFASTSFTSQAAAARVGFFALVAMATAIPALAADEPQTPFEKECHATALLLERDVNANDPAFVERYFDIDGCVERALSGIDAPARVVEDFRRGAPGGYFKTFAAALVEANGVRVLRVHQVDKEARILVRVLPKQGGVDYLDLAFEKTRRNGTRIVDAEMYAQGKKLSEAVRYQFLPLANDSNRGFLDDLSGPDRELAERWPVVSQMAALNGSGRYSEVPGMYSKLPSSVQKSKPALMQYLIATSQVDVRNMAAGLDLWRATYPGGTAIELIAAKLHHAKRHYDPAYAALDRFEKAFGGDAYLDVVRAQWQKNQGNLDQARPYARKAVASNPKLHEGWEMLVGLGLAVRNYAEVGQTLNDWEKATQVDVVRIAESEKLADFARSSEGRQWLASRDSSRGSAKSQGQGTAAAKVNHRLQGIFYSASNPSAIISGRTVFTGDRLVGGYRVERISAKAVTLQSPEGESVELALK